TWGDYSIESTFRVVDPDPYGKAGDAWFGFVVRDNVWVFIRGNWVTWNYGDGNGEHTIADITNCPVTNDTMNFRLDFKGNTATAYVNGKQVGSDTSTRQLSKTGGLILHVNNCSVLFSDFRVTPL
ncbi:MAG TPA: hypothetical protein VHV83_20285, partial [Armatimonadota bacterium]|nr:hypothetical protein [Armatimonadota bacterium]